MKTCVFQRRKSGLLAQSQSLFLALGLLILVAAGAQANIWYVSPNGSDANSGTSWAAAKATVQAGINAAFSGDQVWVEEGTYTLSTQITLSNSVAVYGGFNGTETQLSQRNYVNNVTTLNGNNATRVIYVPSNTSLATRIDGFTITDGNAQNNYGGGIYCNGAITIANNNIIANTTGSGGNDGGGIFCNGVSPTILSNTISNNSAANLGGGIAYESGASPTISGNIISGNNAAYDGGGILSGNNGIITNNTIFNNSAGRVGGGVAMYGSNTTFTGNILSKNTAGGGGGLYIGDGDTFFIANDTFLQNDSLNQGGGILIDNSTAGGTVKDCLFANNNAGQYGGGIYSGETNTTVIANNTVVGNSAGEPTWGGGIYDYYGGGYSGANPAFSIANNIIAFNSSGIAFAGSPNPTLTTNDVYGSTYDNYDGLSPGATDISFDPLFVNQAGGDYHLATTSPCIDVGTDSFVAAGDTDLDGLQRIYGPHVDIGAYEWHPGPYPDISSVSTTTLCAGIPGTGTVTLTGGLDAIGVVTLTAAAPTGGIQVPVASDNTVAYVPRSVFIPAGKRSSKFLIATQPVSAKQTASISASFNGVTKSAKLSVVPVAISSLTLLPSSVANGENSVGIVQLATAAPSAVLITITAANPSNNPTLVVPDSTLVIPAGANVGTFNISTGSTTTPTAVKITVSAYGVSKSNTLTVTGPG